jgi:pilus assembly protein CpaB
MDRRRLLLIGAAVAVAFVTAQISRSLVRSPEPVAQPESVKSVRVLVAADDLPAGLLVQPANLRWQAWPDKDTGAFIVDGSRRLEEFAGAVVRQGLRAGEPIVEGRLVKPGERGFLAAVLNPDMRAVSVPINAVTGIAGFVFPGDHVDVVLTHNFSRPDDPELPNRRASETVLTDVRVLAIDQRTSDQDGKPATAQIATLEVTPKQAELLPLVVDLGQLSLSLRSLARPDVQPGKSAAAAAAGAPETGASGQKPAVPKPRTFTWDSDASALLPKPSDKDAVVQKVKVFRGTNAAEVIFPRGR